MMNRGNALAPRMFADKSITLGAWFQQSASHTSTLLIREFVPLDSFAAEAVDYRLLHNKQYGIHDSI